MVSAMKTAGMCMIVLAVAIFFAIPFMIINYGPVWSGLVFAFVALMACGAVLIGRANIRRLPDEFKEEERVEPERPIGMEPEVMSGIGCGYCSKCGSPLSPGDIYCGVCGRRLRSWASSEGTPAGSSSAYPWRR